MNLRKITIFTLACLMALPAPAMQLPSFAHFAFSKSKLAWGISALAGLGALAYFAYKYKFAPHKPAGITEPVAYCHDFSDTHTSISNLDKMIVMSTQQQNKVFNCTKCCASKNGILYDLCTALNWEIPLFDHTTFDDAIITELKKDNYWTHQIFPKQISTSGVLFNDSKLTLFSQQGIDCLPNRIFVVKNDGTMADPFSAIQNQYKQVTFTPTKSDLFLVLLAPNFDLSNNEFAQQLYAHKDKSENDIDKMLWSLERLASRTGYAIIPLKKWVPHE